MDRQSDVKRAGVELENIPHAHGLAHGQSAVEEAVTGQVRCRVHDSDMAHRAPCRGRAGRECNRSRVVSEAPRGVRRRPVGVERVRTRPRIGVRVGHLSNRGPGLGIGRRRRRQRHSQGCGLGEARTSPEH